MSTMMASFSRRSTPRAVHRVNYSEDTNAFLFANNGDDLCSWDTIKNEGNENEELDEDSSSTRSYDFDYSKEAECADAALNHDERIVVSSDDNAGAMKANCKFAENSERNPVLARKATRERLLSIGVERRFLLELQMKAMTSSKTHWKSIKQRPWEDYFQDLLAWTKRFNTFSIPRISGGKFVLARWADKQRVFYKMQKEGRHFRGVITKERIDRLNAIGFPWTLGNNKAGGARSIDPGFWNMRFKQLQDYYKLYDHSNVPLNWGPNTALSHWVVNMRRKHSAMLKGKGQKILTEARVRLLNQLDFVWRPNPTEYTWTKRFTHLKVFHSAHGHCNVPPDYFLDSNLCFWVRSQRWLKLEGGLTKNRVAMLEKLGFSWIEDVKDKNRIEEAVKKSTGSLAGVYSR